MKIHELLTPENIGLDFAPSPGQELKSLISLACSGVRASSEATLRFTPAFAEAGEVVLAGAPIWQQNIGPAPAPMNLSLAFGRKYTT